MIKRPTVFVLGAGASFPYGFPTGEALVNEIISLTQHEQTLDIFLHNECLSKDVKRFGHDLAASDALSVDAFLEYRPEYLTIGKLAICRSLIPRERDSALTRSYRQSSQSRNQMAWYHYLWNQMTAPRGCFGENKVSFVTLNYDRSLERFFFFALKAKYGYDNDEECLNELYRIPFVHLYGSLGDRRFSEERFDRPTPTPEEVRRASERLRIIHEETTEAPYLAQATQMLKEASVICFLGYGFHALNNQRLNLVELSEEDRKNYATKGVKRRWFASRYGLTDVEFHRVTGSFFDRFRKEGHLETAGASNDGALEILRKLPVIE